MRFSSRLVAIFALLSIPMAAAAQGVESAPTVVLDGVPFHLTLSGADDSPSPYEVRDAEGVLLASGTISGDDPSDTDDMILTERAQLPLQVSIAGAEAPVHPTLIPAWFSLLPPVLAILLALVFREVITALFAGVWLGALMVAGFNPVAGTWRLIDQFVVPALGDVDGGHTQIVVFSLLLGGMVGIIARNGGTLGIVEAVAPFARSARRGKLATWAAGLAIFFDDYANTLIVGNTMRPITDRLKISREKLAYLVDSTAAPVAALVPISTWVGYEVSLIGDGLRIAAEQNPANAEVLLALSPFSIFIQTIPYLFYPILALTFVFLTSYMDTDFGPMAAAERRAARGEGLFRTGAVLATDTSSTLMEPKEGATHKWWNAGLPVLTVVFVVLVGLYTTGRAAVGPDGSLMDVFGAAAAFNALLWGSLAGCLMAIALSVIQRILTVQESIDAWLGGMRAMMIAMIILVLAWSLGKVTEEVGTAEFLSQILSDRVALELIPVIVFVTSAAMAFATGTSWGTMAILVPLVIPLTVALGGSGILPGATGWHVLLGSVSSVLAGAIFGDHCSPISDTTVLSSTASACDHVDHVRTQLPYALLVAGIGMLVGDIGTAYGLPPWVAIGSGILILFVFLKLVGTKLGRPETESG
jgi:Na+/H+ antiporter NhaC